MIYLLENSRGLEWSRLLWQEHFLEAGASQGPLQGVFLLHIPDVLLQLPQGDRCLQRHIKNYGGSFFLNISQQTAALNDALVQFTIISRPTNTMASISFASQANISPEAPGQLTPKTDTTIFHYSIGFWWPGCIVPLYCNYYLPKKTGIIQLVKSAAPEERRSLIQLMYEEWA